MSVVDLPRVTCIAASNAFQNEKSLIRCTAHSEWISDPGTPQTFCGVRGEERVVEAAAEVHGDEVLERLDVVPDRRQLAARVRERAQRRLDDAEPDDDVRGLERIREVLAVVVDPREARPDQELLVEDLLPQPLHLLRSS